MKWPDIQKDWKHVSKSFKTKWNKLTDADLEAVAGRRDQLIDRLAKAYDKDKAALGKEVDTFIETLHPAKT